MITGFNTDVDYDGRVYHVQTEDKGVANPVVESLVYSGGEIVTSRRASYAELLDDPGFEEADVLRRMEEQHRDLVREIRDGRYDPDGPKPFGYNIVSNRSLDEVVFEYLEREVAVERIRLEMIDTTTLVAGESCRLELRVVDEDAERPVGGARVRAKLISTSERPRVLFEGETDEHGTVESTFELPVIPEAECAVLFQADAAGGNAEIKQLVRARRDAPPVGLTPAAPPSDEVDESMGA